MNSVKNVLILSTYCLFLYGATISNLVNISDEAKEAAVCKINLC